MNNGLPPLPDDLLPCPFCGVPLKPDNRRNTGASHPINPECVLSGWFIGAYNLPGWQLRRHGGPQPPATAPASPAPTLSMTVEGNRPVFYDDARGRAVSARELNLYIDWYEVQRENGRWK